LFDGGRDILAGEQQASRRTPRRRSHDQHCTA
jgi:hypothetical protein